MKRIKIISLYLVFFICALVFNSALAINIASWNIQRLGQGSKKDYAAIASIIVLNRVDLIAIQEVMNEKGIETLRRSVSQVTGEKWEILFSHRNGKNSYKEMYAFMWRPSKVKYFKNAIVYLDPTHVFAREPFSALFEDENTHKWFLLATVHIVFGKKVSSRNKEVKELASYWAWLEASFPDYTHKMVLMGDFNMKPQKKPWLNLKKLAYPLITNDATTLSAVDGKFVNLYDNFWVSNNNLLHISASRILSSSPKDMHLTHQQFRRSVSDHVPIMLSLN